jgi:hypothetical protein
MTPSELKQEIQALVEKCVNGETSPFVFGMIATLAVQAADMAIDYEETANERLLLCGAIIKGAGGYVLTSDRDIEQLALQPFKIQRVDQPGTEMLTMFQLVEGDANEGDTDN